MSIVVQNMSALITTFMAKYFIASHPEIMWGPCDPHSAAA